MPCTIQCVFVAKQFRSERTQIVFDTRGDDVGPRIDITKSNGLFVASNYTSITKPAILDKIYDVVFAVSKDSTDVYIDGEKEATLAAGEAKMTRLNLGANSATFYGDWLMYRQFNYLMSADEVKALDNNGDPMGYKPVEYTERPEITTPGNELREVYVDNGDSITVTWDEYTPEPVPELTYEQQVVALIREKYTSDDETALLRQRDTKPEEFEEYFAYCEECKKTVKQKLGII